jgi:hypothetical protein
MIDLLLALVVIKLLSFLSIVTLGIEKGYYVLNSSKFNRMWARQAPAYLDVPKARR